MQEYEQTISRDQTIKFAETELNQSSNDAGFQPNLWKKLAKFGLFGICVDDKYGGLGLSCVETCSVLDALGYSMADHGLLHAACTQILCAVAIDRFGSTDQKESLLPSICDGSIIMAQAMTEPNAGSSLADISTVAEREDDFFKLNGSKVFISNAPIADYILVFCVTNPERKSFGRQSCLVVEATTAGLTKGKPMEKMGLQTLQNGELFFSDCLIPTNCLLGKQGNGDSICNEVMTWERIILFATMVGKQEKMIENSIKYANERKQGGSSIGKNQAISHKIADMKVNQHLSRLIVKNAAEIKDTGKPTMLESSICKLFVSESLKSCALNAVQIMGGYGYMKEFKAEQNVRDSLASTIYSGTSEIQRNIIARLLGL